MNLLSTPNTSTVPESFEPFYEGDLEPCSNKRIHALIHSEKECIVYLDEDLTVQWFVNDHYGHRFAKGFSNVKNRMSYLEELSSANRYALAPRQLEAFRRMLAEAMATALDVDQKNAVSAMSTLQKAEEYFRARSSERARFWYLTASIAVTVLLSFGLLAVWAWRQELHAILGPTGFLLCFGAGLGGVGAFFWIVLRFRNIVTDVTAGRWIHYLEGVLRILAGMTGGFVIVLAIKANVILGFIGAEDNLVLLALFCIAAGASERMVPNLIKKVDIIGTA